MTADIRTLARAAAEALTAMVGARDDAIRDMGIGCRVSDFLRARERAEAALDAFAMALYDAGRVLLGDEVNAMRCRVAAGIVADAWALRCVRIGEEVSAPYQPACLDCGTLRRPGESCPKCDHVDDK